MVIAIAMFLFCVVCILYNSEDCAMLYFPEIQGKEEDGQSEEERSSEEKQPAVAESISTPQDVESVADLASILGNSDPVSKE